MVVENSVKGFPLKYLRFLDGFNVSDQIQAYLSSHNSRFLVVGVLGFQGVGKSFILNKLLDVTITNSDDYVFREHSFEKQMMCEHSTNGLNAWIDSNRRIIFLDSQPVMSSSIHKKSVMINRKLLDEFETPEISTEIQSLQLTAFIMSICHIVIVVEENNTLCSNEVVLNDRITNFLSRAEMLRPMSPAFNKECSDDSNCNETTASIDVHKCQQIVAYNPQIVFIHNKIHSSNINGQEPIMNCLSRNVEKVYQDQLLSKLPNVRCHLRPPSNTASKNSTSIENIDVIPLCINNEHFNKVHLTRLKEDILNFDKCEWICRQPITTLQNMSEKGWFDFAYNTWTSIRTSQIYNNFAKFL